MRALVYDKISNSFSVKDIPLSEPLEGEVRVKVFSTSLNPVDAKVRIICLSSYPPIHIYMHPST